MLNYKNLNLSMNSEFDDALKNEEEIEEIEDTDTEVGEEDSDDDDDFIEDERYK